MAEKKRREEPALGELLSTVDGELRVGGARAVMITESAFVFLQQVIHEQMPELLTYGFYDMGYRAGLDMADAARGKSETPEEAFARFVATYRMAGYGQIEILQFDLAKPEGRLRGTNLLESAAAARSAIYRTPRAVDHYTRGMLAGLFSRVLGKEVICEEVACQYRGDEACEFVVLPFAAED